MSGPKRFVVECVWSGYVSSQARPCHRTVETGRRVAALQKIDGVIFTDGTTMSVSVRPAAPREKVQEIHGYDQLLSDFARRGMTGWCRVADLREVTP